jgi:hypothetical protein
MRTGDAAAIPADLLVVEIAFAGAMFCGTGATPRKSMSSGRSTARERDTLELLRSAGGKILAVNVTLIWKTSDDLDLSVTCPGGKRIVYTDKNNCGGMLDIDASGKPASEPAAVENIGWPAGAAPAGLYKVEVNAHRAEHPIDFSVELRIDGKLVEQYSRQINARKISVFEFTLPYAGR